MPDLYSPTPLSHAGLGREGWMATSLLYLSPCTCWSRNSPALANFFTFLAELSSSSRIATLFYCCHKIHLVGWFGKQTPLQNMEYQMHQLREGRKGRRGERFLAAFMYKFIEVDHKVGHRTSYTMKTSTNALWSACPLPKVREGNSSFQHIFLIQAHQPCYFASKCTNL